MTEAEELQSILSEPGKAVGKYFENSNHIFYVFADTRDIPMETDDEPYLYLMAQQKNVASNTWRRWHERLHKMQGGGIHSCLTRVRKADTNRNLNLKVGMKVRLVNGDVHTIVQDHQRVGIEYKPGHTFFYKGALCIEHNSDPYHPLHICEVIEEAENAGGLLDSVKERLRKVEREIVDIKNAQRELEGLV